MGVVPLVGTGTVTCKYLLEDVNGQPTDTVDSAATCPQNPLPGIDQAKMKALIDAKWKKEESIWNTAFAPPAQCPGLFRYGRRNSQFLYINSR